MSAKEMKVGGPLKTRGGDERAAPRTPSQGGGSAAKPRGMVVTSRIDEIDALVDKTIKALLREKGGIATLTARKLRRRLNITMDPPTASAFWTMLIEKLGSMGAVIEAKKHDKCYHITVNVKKLKQTLGDNHD